jgi:hypothetical protein
VSSPPPGPPRPCAAGMSPRPHPGNAAGRPASEPLFSQKGGVATRGGVGELLPPTPSTVEGAGGSSSPTPSPRPTGTAAQPPHTPAPPARAPTAVDFPVDFLFDFLVALQDRDPLPAAGAHARRFPHRHGGLCEPPPPPRPSLPPRLPPFPLPHRRGGCCEPPTPPPLRLHTYLTPPLPTWNAVVLVTVLLLLEHVCVQCSSPTCCLR